jgi:DNA primase
VRYLKLRKIQRLIEENQQDMKKPNSEEELKIQMQAARHLKDLEKDLMRDLGTVATKYV